MSQTFHRGNGGYVVEGSSTVHVGSWTLKKIGENAVTTNSGTAGWRTRKNAIKDWTFSLEMPWDSEQVPDTDLNLDIGTDVTVTFMMGNSGKFYTGPAVVSGLTPVCNSDGDIVRISIEGEGNGALTDPVT